MKLLHLIAFFSAKRQQLLLMEFHKKTEVPNNWEQWCLTLRQKHPLTWEVPQ